jgi:hypothetical protein
MSSYSSLKTTFEQGTLAGVYGQQAKPNASRRAFNPVSDRIHILLKPIFRLKALRLIMYEISNKVNMRKGCPWTGSNWKRDARRMALGTLTGHLKPTSRARFAWPGAK